MPGNLHEVPEWVLAQWPEPNYVDPVRRPWLPAFAIVLPAVSTVLISGRFWLRATKQAGNFGLDDVFIAIGWVCLTTFIRAKAFTDEPAVRLRRLLRHGSHQRRMVRPRSTHLGCQAGAVRRRRPERLDCPSLVSNQHLRDKNLCPPLLPPHGSRHLQQTMALRDLGGARIPWRVLRLHPVRLLLHLPAAKCVLGELQLRLRSGVHLHRRQYPEPVCWNP